MAKDKNVSDSNFGCLIVCVVVTIIALILTSQSPYWLLLIPVVWLLGASVITENNKKNENESSQSSHEIISTSAITSQHRILIKEDDYNGLRDTLSLLVKQLKTISHDKEVFNTMLSVAKDKDTLDSSFGPENFNNTLILWLGKDVFYCYEHLDLATNMSLDTASGQALLAITMFLQDSKHKSDEDYRFFTSIVTGNDDINISFKETLNEMWILFRDQTDTKVTYSGEEDFSLIWGLRAMNGDRYIPQVRKLLNKMAVYIACAAGMTSKRSEWLSVLHSRKETDLNDNEGTLFSPDSTATVEDLDKLIGLNQVKTEVMSMKHFIEVNQRRQQAGMKTPHISYHCVFTGNPGTGKTTVARIVAGIYKDLGILKKGHLIETDRSGLVAEYVGQTAVKTNRIIDTALDGVLFIDEAYSLVDGGNGDFGKEAISTLVKRMEDDRDRLVVILAGYADEMEKFIESNPGLRSRFNRYIHFEDYTAIELMQIYKGMVEKYDFNLMPDAEQLVQKHLEKCVAHKEKDFGNARYVRNLFERTIKAQAVRLAGIPNTDKIDLAKITADDILSAITEEEK